MEPMRVCFSHRTAFQMVRAIDAREFAEARAPRSAFPTARRAGETSNAL